MKKINNLIALFTAACVLSLFGQCTKAELADDFEPAPAPPIGDYKNSDDVLSGNLVAKWSFNGNVNESKNSLSGTATSLSFISGIKDQSLQGSDAGFITYPTAPASLATLKSFSVSFWAYLTGPVANGAQQIFQIENTNDFWSNLTVYFDGTGTTDNYLRFKTQFHKEGVAYADQFPAETRIESSSGVFNKWIHIVATYDAASSIYRVYLNSAKLSESTPLQAGPTGPNYGDLVFADMGRLIFGTWKQKIGAAGDSWQLNYNGRLDEFRIYNKALSDNDISVLYRFEKVGN